MDNDDRASSAHAATIKGRRKGYYGHFVMPIEQLLEDVSKFLGCVNLNTFLAEASVIDSASMGVHPEEAIVLYCLTRAIKPKIFLETGTFRGYSTTEIAKALRANDIGHMLTVDVDPAAGDLVPADLAPFVTFYRGIDSYSFREHLKKDKTHIDFFFHDSLHTYMNALGELIWFARFFRPGTVIVCHDSKMDFKPDFGVGRAVREFAQAVEIDYLILDTNCGLAVLQWPDRISDDGLSELEAKYEQMEREARLFGRVQRVIHRIQGIWRRRQG